MMESKGRVKAWLDANGAGKDMLLMGDKVCFGDINIAACLQSYKIVNGEESAEWKKLSGLHGGKWGAFLKQFEAFAKID